MLKVGVIGGGVNGICSAIKILEHYRNTAHPVQVTVISDEFTPNTTGDGSAGLWSPYLCSTENEKIYRWSKSVHNFLETLWLSEDAGEAGVCLLPCIRLTTASDGSVEDFWRDIVYGCVELTPQQLDALSAGRKVGKKFTAGLSFVTYTSEPIKLLPYLMKRYARSGGKVVKQKVENFAAFVRESPYDVIVNCTGLGSRQLLNDQTVFAVRGQVSRVQAPWQFMAILDESDDGNYIIPNCESVVLGGTHQARDYNTNVDPLDAKFIFDGCRQLVPGMAHAQHLFDWVGLRPGCEQLRLDSEQAGNKILIHNYGHGGSGVTLAWGCADDVLQLFDNAIKQRNLLKSKL